MVTDTLVLSAITGAFAIFAVTVFLADLYVQRAKKK